MAENSPLRRNRQQQSPRKHPYEKPLTTATTGRSPLRNIQEVQAQQKANLAQSLKNRFPKVFKATNNNSKPQGPLPLSLNDENKGQGFSHLSFSGGSTLFPLSQPVGVVGDVKANRERTALRRAISEVTGNIDKTKNQPAATIVTIEEDEEVSQKRRDFGAIGENRRSSSSLGFIPLDKSCIIGGNEIHTNTSRASASANTSTSISEAQGTLSECGSGAYTANVTSGVLGQLQPRGLNTSFTEKFESRLGLNSNSDPSLKPQPLGDHGGGTLKLKGRSVLAEKFIPLFDFPEYSPQILKYWGRLERKFKVKSDYMSRHKCISHKMRTILIDWITEVILEYELNEQTLHLAVNYVDRFLSKMNVERTKLQLIGTTALFIAAKFEETHPPETADYVFVTDEAYTKDQILEMERLVLTVLDFDLMMPTAHDFALSYCSILQLGDPIKSLAMYLVDLSLMDGGTYLKYLPSVIAGAAVVLGRYSFGGIYWDDRIQGICTHRKKTIVPCIRDLHRHFFNAPTKSQTTIYEKYQSVRYCSISLAFIPAHGPWLD